MLTNDSDSFIITSTIHLKAFSTKMTDGHS